MRAVGSTTDMTTPHQQPLTNDTLRVRIAEALGWTDLIFRGIVKPIEHDFIGRPPTMDEGWLASLPDYENDLNACAQFEAGLTEEQWEVYIEHLRGITARAHPKIDQLRRKVSATALQRCLAYLATVNPEGEK